MAIQDHIGEPLEWTQPRLMSSGYELRNGETVIGTLHFRSSWGSLATARIEPDCWTFKRMGFLKTRVSIKTCESDLDLGLFHNNTWSGGGTLELPDGRLIKANTNFWHSRFEFAEGDGQPLFRYRTKRLLRLSGEMEILPEARNTAELPWLVMLGWYLAVMKHRDAAAVAASAAASG